MLYEIVFDKWRLTLWIKLCHANGRRDASTFQHNDCFQDMGYPTGCFTVTKV